MCILNKGSPFHWDESEQHLFDALKKDLVSTPLEQRLFDALKKALVSTPLINPQIIIDISFYISQQLNLRLAWS